MKLNDTDQSNIYQFQFMRAEETRKIKTVDKAHMLRGEEVLVLGKTQMSCSLCSRRTSQIDFSARSHSWAEHIEFPKCSWKLLT